MIQLLCVMVRGGWKDLFLVLRDTCWPRKRSQKKHGGYAPFGILIGEPSKIIIEGDLESFYTAQVSGSKAHDVLNAYNRLVGETNEAEALMTVVRNHPNSFASAFILERYGKVLTPEQALACYEGLSDAVKKRIMESLPEIRFRGLYFLRKVRW